MRPIVVRSALLLLLGATAWAGCGDPLSLLPAVFENREDTLKLYAASRTPVPFPSGFIISQRTPVRLDQASSFDFLYDVNPAGERIFVPLAALANTGRTSGNPGFLFTDSPFDAITVAVQQGYVSADTVAIRVGDVFYVRSAVDASCGLGIPYYAKLQVLGFDDTAFSVVFRMVANINCGYRGLELGLPKK
jgi:hypothetical protein